MYTPVQFEEQRPEVLRALLKDHPLALLVSHGPSGLQASHLPLVFDGESKLRGHLARANPHWKELTAGPLLAIFTGPEHYVTPSWYPSKAEHGKVVPTWNYIAVHVTGTARLMEDDAELMAMLNALTGENEAQFSAPWHVADAPADYIANLTRAIVGFEIAIAKMEGKWKLSQNRPEADRAGVVQGLERLDTPKAQAVARAMKQP